MKVINAGCANFLRCFAIYRANAFSILKESSKTAFDADLLIGRICGETWTSVFQAVSIIVKRIGWLAGKALVSRPIECTFSDNG